jgi:hypothetical protein
MVVCVRTSFTPARQAVASLMPRLLLRTSFTWFRKSALRKVKSAAITNLLTVSFLSTVLV